MLKAHQGKHQVGQGKNQVKAATKQVRFHVQPGMTSPVLVLTNLLSVLFLATPGLMVNAWKGFLIAGLGGSWI